MVLGDPISADSAKAGLSEANTPQASQIQALFDRIAPVYDQLNDWLSLGQHRIWKKMAVKWSLAKAGDACLDLCCGTGDLTQLLARQVGRQGQVVGVDFSSAQLAIAQQRLATTSLQIPITWVQADVLDLPFPKDSFAAATMGYGLRNVTNITRSLQELFRVLKPGAHAAILDLNKSIDGQIQPFQSWYLDNLVVPVARQFGLTQEYAYLGPSLERFPTSREQIRLAHECGFTKVTHYPIAGGTMGVLVVVKPPVHLDSA